MYELYQYFDEQLGEHEFLAGDNYSIADITALPAVISQEQKLTDYANISRCLVIAELHDQTQAQETYRFSEIYNQYTEAGSLVPPPTCGTKDPASKH